MIKMDITPLAKQAIQSGSIKIRVVRSGMHQQLTFFIKKATTGNIEFVELFTERIVDTSELLRISKDIGLPVEAPNAHAFPPGTSAKDFSHLVSELPASLAR